MTGRPEPRPGTKRYDREDVREDDHEPGARAGMLNPLEVHHATHG